MTAGLPAYGRKLSGELITSIKKRAAIPQSQKTFQDEDILRFANEEMDNVLVPLLLRVKEEFYVRTESVTLASGEDRIKIPYRAVGSKLRNIYMESASGGSRKNMTRIQPEDVGEFQYGQHMGSKACFYLEGDEVVLVSPTGIVAGDTLKMSFYLKPNDIVIESRVPQVINIESSAEVEVQSIAFSATPDSGNFTLSYNDVSTSTLSFSSTAGQIQTALQGIAGLGNVTVSGSFGSGFTVNFAEVVGDVALLIAASNSLLNGVTAVTITITEQIRGGDVTDIYLTSLPSHFEIGEYVDFIEDERNHKIIDYDIPILDVNDDVGGTVRITIASADLPASLAVGDHVAIAGESKVPQIPGDLHGMLAQATACRILEAQSDPMLDRAEKTLAKMLDAALSIVDTRTEGNPQKLLQTGGFLRHKRYIV